VSATPILPSLFLSPSEFLLVLLQPQKSYLLYLSLVFLQLYNLVLTYLSIPIAKGNIRQIAIAVLSGNIDSIESSM